MSPEVFRSLAVECLQLAQKPGDSERQSLLIDMADSWASLANSAERFQMLVEAVAVTGPPESSAMSAIKAPGRRLPYSRHRPRSAVIVRLFKQVRTKRGSQAVSPGASESLAIGGSNRRSS
jgi:hypothetical protein